MGGDSHTLHGVAIGMLCIGADRMDVATAMKQWGGREPRSSRTRDDRKHGRGNGSDNLNFPPVMSRSESSSKLTDARMIICL